MGHPNELEHAERQSSNDSSFIEKDIYAHLPLWQSVKKWPMVVAYSAGLSFALLMYGYDYAVVGTIFSMPSFQQDFGQKLNGQWIIPSMWLGLWNAASPLCAMPGALFGGLFQDWFGRRMSLGLGTGLTAVGAAICFVSYLPDTMDARRGVFLAGKGFQGFSIGIMTTTVQTYLSEILPPPLRGPILALFPIFTLVGQLAGALVIFGVLNKSNGYTITFASLWAFNLIPFILSFVIPESPTYLVRKNKMLLALKHQTRISARDGNPQHEVEIILQNIEHERRQTRATYIDCFKGTNRRRTLIVMFVNSVPQLFGLTLLGKASYFMQIMGLDANKSVIILIAGVVCGLIANIISMWVMTKVGRRKLILTSMPVITVIWGTLGIAGCFKGDAVIGYTTACLILVIVVAGLSVWPASYCVGAEASSLHLRGKTQGVGWVVNAAVYAIFGISLPYIFNPDEGNLRGKTGFVYMGLCAIATALCYLYIPEMKGRTAAEIDRMFEKHIPARDFKTWSNESQVTLPSEERRN